MRAQVILPLILTALLLSGCGKTLGDRAKPTTATPAKATTTDSSAPMGAAAAGAAAGAASGTPLNAPSDSTKPVRP